MPMGFNVMHAEKISVPLDVKHEMKDTLAIQIEFYPFSNHTKIDLVLLS
jgi:hypothetical protein